MALQLLKRNYVMGGHEVPKILKLPQGEMRWAPKRAPVDVGDVMMNIRMDDSKNKYIGEHVSKYAQGLNPYGEWGYPYKVNKNNIRPPIIDPKYYQALSRMPVKFDAITAGPIVKNLYEKKAEICKVAPKTIIDRICPDARPRISKRGENQTDDSYHQGQIELDLKQPHSSIPYNPSIPTFKNTGVPQVELDARIITRAQAGIHAPFNVSDQSRDVHNMRTPMHVAVRPGYKDPYTYIDVSPEEVAGINNELYNVSVNPTQKRSQTKNVNVNNEVTLVPKVQTSAWYNPSYYTTNLNGYDIGNRNMDCNVKAPIRAATNSSASSRLLRNGELGDVSLPDSIQPGSFDGKAVVPTIQKHSMNSGSHDGDVSTEYFFVNNAQSMHDQQNAYTATNYTGRNEVRDRMTMQPLRVDRTPLNTHRLNPVNGSGQFATTF